MLTTRVLELQKINIATRNVRGLGIHEMGTEK